MNQASQQVITDPCYGVHYLKEERFAELQKPEEYSPFSTPSKVVRAYIDHHADDSNTGIDGISLKPAVDKSMWTKRLHALGTWHIAEHCLGFGRIRYLQSIDDWPGKAENSLANQLAYGDHLADTLRVEFCLAAFFQAYVGISNKETQTDIGGLLGEVKGAGAEKAVSRIRSNIIGYWVSGQGEEKLGEYLKSLLSEAKSSERLRKEYSDNGINSLQSMRRLYFADDAPLNLRYLDLAARACVEAGRVYTGDEKFRINTTLKRFVSRVFLAPQKEEHHHLLSDKWEGPCPHYIPREDENLPYQYFLEFLIGLLRLALSGYLEESHPLYQMLHKHSEKEPDDPFTGFLRLSLPRRLPSEFAPKFKRYVAMATSPFAKSSKQALRDYKDIESFGW